MKHETLGAAPHFRNVPLGRAWVAILVCLFLAAGLFVFRGPMRSDKSYDFAAPYMASVRLLHGHDPYAVDNFLHDWHANGASPQAEADESGKRPVYPPPTLVAIAPFALLRWFAALRILVWGCALLYVLLLYALAGEIDGRRRRLAFVCFGLALAPVHTALSVGNLSILAFLLCAWSALLLYRNRTVPAGLLLALGCCIKPTIGFTIVLFFFLSRQWKACAAWAASSAAIAGTGLALTSRVDPVWRVHYRENLAYLFGAHGVATYLPVNATRFQLLNLQVPFYELLQSQKETNLAVYAVTGVLLLVWWLLYRRRNAGGVSWSWAAFAAIALMCLLPLYQRTYNASLILVALLAAFQHFRLRSSKWILGVSCVFLLPWETVMRVRVQPHLPAALIGSSLWQVGVLPLSSWAVLLVILLLLRIMMLENLWENKPALREG